jgi:hypothetical protein
MNHHHSNAGAIADAVFAAIALIMVLELLVKIRKARSHGQRLGASLITGAVLATVACAWMDQARHAALASAHHSVPLQLAAGWAVITLATGLAVFVIAAWRASVRARAEEARADRTARTEAAATAARKPARARARGSRGDYGYGRR